MVRTSAREKKPIDRLIDKKTADWKPSTHTTVKRVNSDSRPAENQDEALHYLEKSAERDYHPDNKKVKKWHADAAAQGPTP
tara:strand:+ start:1315 stop:1557 length:243 start_codon:yes stop_codon:yes gene_type:complete